LAHSGGWIVSKIIFWSIFSHFLSKLFGFWVISALLMTNFIFKSSPSIKKKS
jgi:hypothetical protein